MHPLFLEVSEITHEVIGSAIEVHKQKGPGLLESIYEWCLTMELQIRRFEVKNQQRVVVQWKQFQNELPWKFDLLITVVCSWKPKPWKQFFPFTKHTYRAT